MILSDLLTAIHEETQEVLEYEIWLASRSRDGKRLDGKQVYLHNIGQIQIDEDNDEDKLKLIPLAFLDDTDASIEDLRKVANVLQWAKTHGECREDFVLYGVERKGTLTDGRTISLNVPLVGSLVDYDACQFWLLCYPKEHWPKEWFAT